jgi:hypothetical protein
MVVLISRAWRERDLAAFLLEFLHTQVVGDITTAEAASAVEAPAAGVRASMG